MKKFVVALVFVAMSILTFARSNASAGPLGAHWICGRKVGGTNKICGRVHNGFSDQWPTDVCGYNIYNQALPHLWYPVRLGEIRWDRGPYTGTIR
jgi:hypothetical protein